LAAGIVGDAAAREWIGARLAEWLADDDGGRRDGDDDVLTAIKLLVS
jgi:predicted transcriptional regulator